MEPLGPSLRRTRRREHPFVRVAAAVALSLALNVLFLSKVDSSFLGLLSRQEVRPIEIAPLAPSAWEANRAIAPPPRPVPPAPPVPPPPVVDPKTGGQIVDLGQERPGDEKTAPPADAKYLSERNTRVEKETRARNQGLYDTTLPSPTVVVKPGGEGGEADRAAPGRAGKKGEKPAERLAMARPDLGAAPPSKEAPGDLPGGEVRLPDGKMAPAPAPGEGGDGGERLRGRFDPRLATSPETLARLAGGPAPDYLGDLEEGSATLLNSRQWKYTTYFTAMRPGIYANWKPEEAYLMRDPEGTMFPARKWITYLEVVLDDRGYLKSAKVIRPSGLDFLDRAAVEAFRGAAPFLNPPNGLVENGEIRFAQGFVVDKTGITDQLRHIRRR